MIKNMIKKSKNDYSDKSSFWVIAVFYLKEVYGISALWDFLFGSLSLVLLTNQLFGLSN